MTRTHSAIPILLLLWTLATSTVMAQRPVEELRDVALEKIAAMEIEFQSRLAAAIRQLRRIDPNKDTPNARTVRETLAPWAGVFSDRFKDALRTQKNKMVRRNLIRIMGMEGSPTSAEGLLEFLGDQDDAYIIRTLSNMAEPGPRVTQELLRIANGTRPMKIDARAEAIRGVARHGHPDARSISTGLLKTRNPPEIEVAALDALALLGKPERGDIQLVCDLSRDTTRSNAPRAAALRCLGSFPSNLDSLRALHDALKTEPELILASLDALASIGSKGTSKNYILAVAREHSDEDVRRRAAVVLSDLGIYTGARELVKDLERYAQGRPRDASAHQDVGHAFYELHAWPNAIDWFEKALRISRITGRSELRLWIARCRAQLGQYSKAKDELQKAGLRRFDTLADDPAFAGMKNDARYAPLFDEEEN